MILFPQGEVLGITRFGLAKMKESVLMLASVSIRKARDKRETRDLRDERRGRTRSAFVLHFPKNLAKLPVSLLMRLVSVCSASLIFNIIFLGSSRRHQIICLMQHCTVRRTLLMVRKNVYTCCKLQEHLCDLTSSRKTHHKQ